MEIRKRRKQRLSPIVGATATMMVASICLTGPAHAQTVAVDAALLEQLQELIEQQQQTIDALTNRLDQLEQRAAQAESAANQAQATAEQAQRTAATGDPEVAVVTAGQDKIRLAVSGQINRALNFVDDGDKTEAYFVDNDTSNSRVRFVGTADVTDSTQIGSVLEIAFSPNNSGDVSQDNESADDFTDVRRADLFARNDSFGRIQFGKGSAAADNTAEHDLSLVAGPIMYSGVADIAGGMQFTSGGNLTGVTVAETFINFDGDRQNRIRYDSPVLGPGFQIRGSAGEDEQYDLALLWGTDYGDWSGVESGPVTTLGAVSIRQPNEDNVDYRIAGSFSLLHNPSGFGFTVSAGGDKVEAGDDPYNVYGKLSWDTKFIDIGATGFGIDYTYSKNNTADGDKGQSFGLAAIQLLEDYGTELYAQLRNYDLDRDSGPSFDDMFVATLGARVKF